MDIRKTTSQEVSPENPVAGDIHLENGQMNFFSGKGQTAQRLTNRFNFFRGAWYLDQREGFPYWERVFKKNPNLRSIESMVRRTALTTPKIVSVESVNVSSDDETRRTTISLDARSDENERIEIVDEPFIINIQ